MSIRGWVDVWSKEGAVVRWAYCGTSATQFLVYRAKSEIGPWDKVGAASEDAWGMIDPFPELYGMLRDTWYKVVATIDTGDEESKPFRIDGGIPKRDLLYGREMIRATRLSMVKGNGVRGLLYRRRRWGATCSSCGSAQLGTTTRANCTECFGTGYSGGYFAGLDCWINLERGSQSKITQDDGYDEAETVKASFVGWPLPEVGDLWRSKSDGAVYQIASGGDPLQHAVMIRETPISVVVAMSRLSYNNLLSGVGQAPDGEPGVVKSPHGDIEVVIPADSIDIPTPVVERKVYES